MNLEELKALCENATPGPWEAYDANEGSDPAYRPMWCVANDEFHNPGDEEAEWIAVEVHVGDKGDADFIAAARTALPKLVAAVEAVLAIDSEAVYREVNPDPGRQTPDWNVGIEVGLESMHEKITEIINNALEES